MIYLTAIDGIRKKKRHIHRTNKKNTVRTKLPQQTEFKETQTKAHRNDYFEWISN